MNYINKIFNEDCISGMKSRLPDKSVDMILTDLPYGITDCRWDSLIPFDSIWEEFSRVIKDNGAIVLTATQPFTTKLINSNLKLFKYCWYWKKNMVTGFAFSKYQPLRCMEDICVFYKNTPTYNPQGLMYYQKPKFCKGKHTPKHGESVYRNDKSLSKDTYQKAYNYPKQILNFNCQRGLHPTQKPLELFEYLIKTYTNENELILDCCMGSGTTKISAINTNRNFVGFEIDEQHYNTAINRIN